MPTNVISDDDSDEAYCGTCSSPVTWDDQGICCDTCDRWHHATCQHINNTDYDRLTNSETEWRCSSCVSPPDIPVHVHQSKRIKLPSINVGTLNVRGMKSEISGEAKRKYLAHYMEQYKLQVLAIQETHINEMTVEKIRSGKKQFDMYLSNNPKEDNKTTERAGVGFVVQEDLKACFTPISHRICLLKVKVWNRNIVIINAYAPTQPVSKKHPEMREEFYNNLEATIRKVSNRDELIIAGDFNAKTGSAYKDYPDNMGPYGIGIYNSNGAELLDLANRHELIISNTMFKHKLAHVTTWESNLRRTDTDRRNPYRNQIDYILVQTKHKHKVINSRSYNGTTTFTDHRLVKMKYLSKPQKDKSHKTNKPINLEKMKDPLVRAQYKFNVEMKMMDNEYKHQREGKQPGTQDTWTEITDINHMAAVEVLGYKTKKQFQNPDIEQLSQAQKSIREKINATKSEEKKSHLKRERNKTLDQLHKLTKAEKEKKIERELKEIEDTKDDSNRMYKAVRNLQRMKKKDHLLVQSEDGLTTNPEEQINIISKFFHDMFTTDNTDEIENIPPSQMRTPFTATEVHAAIRSLKNGKSPGVDGLTAEQLKNCPAVTYEMIADVMNKMAQTGEHPQEIKQGLLIPLQKPGKPKGPPGNLRPIVLLSILRKIVAICLLKRIGKKLDEHIPLSQAAYREGRGTTEQVFAMKLLAEKAVTSSDYTTYILMMDMSKAFDTVSRPTLINDLKQILMSDELHLIKLLIQNVQLSVKIKGRTGPFFMTNVGTPQGDGLSPILFTLYLAKALKPAPSAHLIDHDYSACLPQSQVIPLQYADDICWIGTNSNDDINQIKERFHQCYKNDTSR